MQLFPRIVKIIYSSFIKRKTHKKLIETDILNFTHCSYMKK